MTRRSAPPFNRCVANVWRSPCGPMRTGISPALRYFSTTRETLRVVIRRPWWLRNTGLSPFAARFHFIVCSTGVRVSEAVNLNWGDVDIRLGVIRVMGKGSKERIVPIGEVALKALEEYAAEQTLKWKRAAKGDHPVFLNHRGRRID